MGKARRNPFRGLMDMMSEMNRMREYVESGQEAQERTHATAWVPTTDIFARGGDLIIRTELAGVSRQDIDVSLSDGVLTIAGERTGEPSEEEVSYYVRERFYGAFRRSLTLPQGIDKSKISASFEDGMLEITARGAAVTAEIEHIPVEDTRG